jgi:hypothetical protein
MEKLAADSGGKRREIWRMISIGRLLKAENSSALRRGGGKVSNFIQENTFLKKSIATKINVNTGISHCAHISL